VIDIFEGLTGTQALAVWGAVTGTIGTFTGVLGLWLRFRHQKRDQAKLTCEARFDFEVSNGVPSSKYKIIIRSIGRRPVTLDTIEYRYNPDTLKDRLLKHRLWRTGKWASTDDVDHQKTISLTEGQKVELPIEKHRLNHLAKICRVFIHDQTGRKWRVKWPNAQKLEMLTRHGQLDRIEEENSRRTCKVVGYNLRSEFYLFTHWNVDPPSKSSHTGKTFRFDKRSDYDKKLEEIRTIQLPKMLAEELQEIN